MQRFISLTQVAAIALGVLLAAGVSESFAAGNGNNGNKPNVQKISSQKPIMNKCFDQKCYKPCYSSCYSSCWWFDCYRPYSSSCYPYTCFTYEYVPVIVEPVVAPVVAPVTVPVTTQVLTPVITKVALPCNYGKCFRY